LEPVKRYKKKRFFIIKNRIQDTKNKHHNQMIKKAKQFIKTKVLKPEKALKKGKRKRI